MKKLKPLAILGAGSWGTALALHLSRLGQEVRLWTIEIDHVHAMIKDGLNKRYLPTHVFPKNLIPIQHLEEAVRGAEDILIAIPSSGFRSALILLKPLVQPNTRIICAAKGMDDETGQFLQEVTQQILDKHPYAVLSGPSFAMEVAAGMPTAVVVASSDLSFARQVQQRLNGRLFRAYVTTDVIGVEIGGAVKNVLAIATGISDGMGFGSNARCALIARGLNEMVRLGLAFGAKYETMMGLSGLGDLVLTCTDNQSRNRRFGVAIGQGKLAKDAEREIGQVIEGKRNTELVYKLAIKHNIDMPLVAAVFNILKGHKSSKEIMEDLLAREPKMEW